MKRRPLGVAQRGKNLLVGRRHRAIEPRDERDAGGRGVDTFAAVVARFGAALDEPAIALEAFQQARDTRARSVRVIRAMSR